MSTPCVTPAAHPPHQGDRRGVPPGSSGSGKPITTSLRPSLPVIDRSPIRDGPISSSKFRSDRESETINRVFARGRICERITNQDLTEGPPTTVRSCSMRNPSKDSTHRPANPGRSKWPIGCGICRRTCSADQRAEVPEAPDGVDIIDLGMGNPTDPPARLRRRQALRGRPRPPQPPLQRRHGVLNLRREVAAKYEDRYGVELDPETEVIATIGSKEGLQPHVPGPAGARRHGDRARRRPSRSTSTPSRWPAPT